MKVTINSQSGGGIIIVDMGVGLAQIPVQVSRMEFEIIDDVCTIIEIGTTTLTPTVKNNVTGFEFDEKGMSVNVLGQSQESVYQASSESNTVLVRVDFGTSTITVFE